MKRQFPKVRCCLSFLLLNCLIVSPLLAQTNSNLEDLLPEDNNLALSLNSEFSQTSNVDEYARQAESKLSQLLRRLESERVGTKTEPNVLATADSITEKIKMIEMNNNTSIEINEKNNRQFESKMSQLINHLKGDRIRKLVETNSVTAVESVREKIQKIEADNNINLQENTLALSNNRAMALTQISTIDDGNKSLEEFRQELKIQPKVVLSQQRQSYPPSLSAGIPSAFGANWGDTFISFSGATAGKERNKVDGSISLGFGLGDSYKLAGLTFAYNIGSIRDFGSNGTFDLQGSRVVYADRTHQVAAAIGWSSFGQYGNGKEGIIPSTLWGEVTSVTLLNPEDSVNKLPLLLSVGIGGGYFSGYEGNTNAFGGIGLQVAPQLGLGLAWSGVGLNVGLSFVPVPTIPLTLTATGGDLTNASAGGSRFILSVSYGYNFVPRSY